MTTLLLSSPWLGLLAFVVLVVRKPRELPDPVDRGAPFVSVIVPARDEALNIEACVRSLVASSYPSFEVIVVDDRSSDGTGDIARRVDAKRAARLVVVDGEELPEGWLGKPWACWQGARLARGELLLFTDADTVHEPGLLGRAVAGLHEGGADLLTVLGRQIMGSFWERLVQPQVFLIMVCRFPRFERIARNTRWRDAIANGQYLLFKRSSYDAIGGHETVRDEVAEDLALAQYVKRAGQALRVRTAEQDLATRMYRSLPHLVEGWSKNMVMGGLQTVPKWARPLVPPLSLLSGVVLWLLPPVVLVLSLSGVLDGDWLAWSAMVCAISVVIFGYFTWWLHGPVAYALLYPLGAAVGSYIFVRSWSRGRNVTWKGRDYRLPPASERA